MLSTGDLQNSLRKLQTELRFIKFRDVDYKSLQTGNPCEFLKIYHYLFLDFNPLFAKSLLDKYNFDFYGKTDSHFMDTLYKALRDHFNYKPPITKEQFFTTGFAERKVQMICDVISSVRQESKEINMLQQQKRASSATQRFGNGEKEKKRNLSNSQQTNSTNVFAPLRDMSLEQTDGNENFLEDFRPNSRKMQNPKEKNIEKWLDATEFESFDFHQNGTNNLPVSVPKTTIDRIEEQIQELKIRVDDINARLENVTSILQETQPGNNNFSVGDLSNFNGRLVIIENELAMLRRKAPQSEIQRVNPPEPTAKASFVPQGILVESDDEENNLKSYAIEEPSGNFDIVDRARSLLENAEQCNRDLLKRLQSKS